MGNFLSAMRQTLTGILDSFSERHAKILMLGIDNAGKTTVLYKYKLNELVTTIPTIGFNVETVQLGKNICFTVWDVGGQDKIRVLWKHYFVGCEGLVYVVDSSDRTRFAEARNELDWILGSDEMSGVPLVVLANKQDLPQAATPSEVANRLGLSKIRGRKWHVQGTCASIGDGLLEGMQELSVMLSEYVLGVSKYVQDKTEHGDSDSAKYGSKFKPSGPESTDSIMENKEEVPTIYFNGNHYPYYKVEMGDGTPCDLKDNIPRSVNIYYICDMNAHSTGRLFNIEEVTTCKYEAVFALVNLCQNKAYRHDLSNWPSKQQLTELWRQDGYPSKQQLIELWRQYFPNTEP